MARSAMVELCGWGAHVLNPRIRHQIDVERLQLLLASQQEAEAIKDRRMAAIPPNQRPRYAPIDRMRVVEWHALYGRSKAETARRFQIEPETLAEWIRRLKEPGDSSLIQLPEPVNRYPVYVRYVTQRLKVLCPLMGKIQIAQTLAHHGLHLAATTVGRILREPPVPPSEESPLSRDIPEENLQTDDRVVTAGYPHHVWHVDLTLVPTGFGFWLSWLPFSLPQCWAYGWWVAVVVDHFSRQVVGMKAFFSHPASSGVQRFLGRLIRRIGRGPRHIVCDRGRQFDCPGFRAWCRRHGVQRPRYGAVGKRGSIAVLERFIRSLKQEHTRRILVSLTKSGMDAQLAVYQRWYNRHRPHQGRNGLTPFEIVRGGKKKRRLEPRSRYPTSGDTQRVNHLRLVVIPFEGHRHLPTVELQAA